MLAILALLIDRVPQHRCGLFKKAREYQKRNFYLWDKMRRLFLVYSIPDWQTFYLAMSRKMTKPGLEDIFPSGP